MKVKLVIVSPEVKPNEYDLTLPAKIGRGHEAKLKLVHPLVSRLHCELFNQGEQVFIRDLDSLNGTFVDQERIDEDTPLASGATVIMGTVMFQVRYGPDRDRLPPPAKKLDKTAAADGTIRSETLERIAKPPAAPSAEELWDQTVEEPTAVVSEEELESLATLDEEPSEAAPRQQSAGQSPKPAAKQPAPQQKLSAQAAGPQRAAATPAPPPAAPLPPVDKDDDDEPFTVAPIDEPADEEPPRKKDDDMDDFLKSIM